MGRATDPGENHDPGKGQFYFQLDPDAPIRERPRSGQPDDQAANDKDRRRCRGTQDEQAFALADGL